MEPIPRRKVNISSLGGTGAVSYQWKRDGINVGAGSTYGPLTAADEAKLITVEVSRSGYTGVKASPSVTPDSIGGTGEAGGIIFYYNAGHTYGAWDYLEAATADISGTKKWSSASTYDNRNITGAIGTAIGTGAANTAAILVVDSGDNAASACADYGNGTSYDDWFLPSQDELNEMYTNRTAIGGFSNNCYWSSSQFTGGVYNNVRFQYFSDGSQGGIFKNYTYYVRAVRTF